jgi:flagellar motor protein MotB
VDFLVSRGIRAARFLYEGRGGTEPVAPSDTEENMAKNRRVEVLILED